MLVFLPWWAWMIWIAILFSLMCAILLWMAYFVIAAFIVYLIISGIAALWWRYTAPDRRAEWRDLYGIPDTPENDWMCEPCFGLGKYHGGRKCTHCSGSGCRDGKPRNLTW